MRSVFALLVTLAAVASPSAAVDPSESEAQAKVENEQDTATGRMAGLTPEAVPGQKKDGVMGLVPEGVDKAAGGPADVKFAGLVPEADNKAADAAADKGDKSFAGLVPEAMGDSAKLQGLVPEPVVAVKRGGDDKFTGLVPEAVGKPEAASGIDGGGGFGAGLVPEGVPKEGRAAGGMPGLVPDSTVVDKPKERSDIHMPGLVPEQVVPETVKCQAELAAGLVPDKVKSDPGQRAAGLVLEAMREPDAAGGGLKPGAATGLVPDVGGTNTASGLVPDGVSQSTTYDAAKDDAAPFQPTVVQSVDQKKDDVTIVAQLKGETASTFTEDKQNQLLGAVGSALEKTHITGPGAIVGVAEVDEQSGEAVFVKLTIANPDKALLTKVSSHAFHDEFVVALGKLGGDSMGDGSLYRQVVASPISILFTESAFHTFVKAVHYTARFTLEVNDLALSKRDLAARDQTGDSTIRAALAKVS
jgi:hypothetical protein